MKVGIITQPLRNNYGGLLQNYALQQVLKKLGHDVITLDQADVPVPKFRIVASFIKTFILKCLGNGAERNYPFHLDKQKETYILRYTQYFVDKYINRTQPMYDSKDFKNYCINNKVDILISGSDQVWRPCYNSNIFRSFFDFAEDLDIKRYAYAASFGVDFWEFTEKQTKECKKLVRLFDAISVREESGVDLCEKYLDCKAEYVLDPTMLLDKEDYEQLAIQEHEPESTGNLFTYILDNTLEKDNIIEKVAKSLNLVPFTVMPKYKVNKNTIKKLDDCVFPPLTQWIRAFMDAKFVVCDSFHGVVFSIIFNKPFLVIGNTKRGLTRFVSLLKQYGLEDRLIFEDASDIAIIDENLDWELINSIRNSLKNHSYSFLQQIHF